MPKRKPIYRSETGSFIPKLEFTKAQIEVIKGVCDRDDFIEEARNAAECVFAINEAEDDLLSISDVRSTLADFGANVADLQFKIDGLPQQVRILLWKHEACLGLLNGMLEQISSATDQVLETLPGSKSGRVYWGLARRATKMVRELLERYDICFSANNWPDAKCAAADCLGVVLEAGTRKTLSREALMVYVKEVVASQ